MKRVAPPGWHSLTPRFFVDDTKAMVGFLRRVFKATGKYRADKPSEILVGDSYVMVSSTEARAAMPACLYVYVEDVDAAYRRALKAGAISVDELQVMPWGDRRAIVKDPWGNVWQIATRKALLKRRARRHVGMRPDGRQENQSRRKTNLRHSSQEGIVSEKLTPSRRLLSLHW
jgi:PhnB protein